jgi:long-chain acyl-CoA synthetase
MATSLTGVKMPMINWHLNETELVACINLSKAKALFVDERFLSKIINVKEKFDNIKQIIVVGDSERLKSLELPAEFVIYQELIDQCQKTTLPDREIIFSLKPFSGGTTGTPKFIDSNTDYSRQSELFISKGPSESEMKNLKLKLLSLFHYLGVSSIHDPSSNNIRSLIATPLYHGGAVIGVLPFILGGTVVTMKKFDPEQWLALIAKERINWAFVAPTLLERVLGLDDSIKNKYNLSSMRSVISAGAPCPAEVKQEINELFSRQGCQSNVFHEYYAGSEAGMVSVLIPSDYESNPERYKSAGKVRCAECNIYDKETGGWAKQGESGNILVRSPHAFQLQYSDFTDEEMRNCYVEVNGKYWYDDGLIGHLDQDDYLYITSRVKEMIISGGVNVYPNEIEEVFKRHEGVVDAAIVGAPDADLGEVVALVVQPKPGAILELEGLRSFGKDNGLYGLKMPKHLSVLEDFPRDSAGKLKKRYLEDLFSEEEITIK